MTRVIAKAIAPLDVAFIVDADALGTCHAITLPSCNGFLVLPQTMSRLDNQVGPPESLEAVQMHWGSWSTRNTATGIGQIALECVGFEFEIDVTFTTDRPLDQGAVKGLEPLAAEITAWMLDFQRWAQVLVHQPLSLLNPSPKTISSPTAQPVLWLDRRGELSRPQAVSQGIRIVIDNGTSGTPLSERVANSASVSRIATLASWPKTSIPSAVALTTDSRAAAQRGQYRLALMEAGTALEALLFHVMRLPSSHKQTLGPLTSRAISWGVPLPSDIQKCFVDPRNLAVHQGVDPARKTAEYAINLLDELIRKYMLAFATDPALPVAHRVQRHNIHIVAGQSRRTD